MIVLDASVLIAYLDAADTHHERAVELLERHVDRPLRASPLTLAEVLVGPTRTGSADTATAVLDDLEVLAEPLPADAPLRLAELRATAGLRMPDCCVLLAAQDAQGAVASFDHRLQHAAELVGLPTLG